MPQQSMVGGQYPYNGGYASEANNQRSKAQLIVGIDFVSIHPLTTVCLHTLTNLLQGTTFSGVAFAFATNTEAKEDIIVEWPGAGTQTKQKVGHKSESRRDDALLNYFARRFPQFSTTTNINKW